MTRQEMYRAARREVERRRLAAETAAEARLEQLHQALPQLAALDEARAAAGARAGALAADGRREEAEAVLAELRELAFSRAALLKAAGVDPRGLEPAYHCPRCRDSGLEEGRTCACVEELVRAARRSQVNLAGPLSLCRFENFSLEHYPQRIEGMAASPRVAMGHVLEDCRAWAEEFGPRSQSLYMFGDAGLGKTHLAMAIAAQVLEAGHDVIYVSAQNAFATIAEQRYEGNELFGAMMEADLLVLDDLGTEYLDAYLLSRLYELVNGRMGRRPTIYTTNIIKQDQLARRYTEKIASRLLGDCHPMRFFGEDLRLRHYRR